MNKFIPLIAILLVACGSPKYTYYFDHYTVTSRTDKALPNAAPLDSTRSDSARPNFGEQDAASSTQIHVQDSPLMVDHKYLSANAGTVTPFHAPKQIQLQQQSKYNQKIQPTGYGESEHLKLDRKQLKQVIKQFRREIHALNGKSKPVAKPTSTLNDQATQKLDNEVITAIVFGAVGITLSLLGGVSAAFWIIGVLCLGVGVYFFVDWLSKR